MSTADQRVVVSEVGKSFGNVNALRDISFGVDRGEVVGLLGPNGAGKTTMVDILSTLTRPDRGRAWVAGHDVVAHPARVRRSIMLTGQQVAIDNMLTGRQNLVLFGRLRGLGKSEARTRATELIEAFDLGDAADRRVDTYSGGMRRRIDIACGLIVRPEVAFLDEPTTGLDPRGRQSIWDLVREFKTAGMATLLTTQYLEEADALCDRIVVVDQGTVIAEGTVDELKRRTGEGYCEITPKNPQDLPAMAIALGSDVARRAEAGRSRRIRPDYLARARRGEHTCRGAAPAWFGQHRVGRRDAPTAVPRRCLLCVDQQARDAHQRPRHCCRDVMTIWTTMWPSPSPLRQWWVLTVRVIAPTVRNGELLIAITMSAGFTAGLSSPTQTGHEHCRARELCAVPHAGDSGAGGLLRSDVRCAAIGERLGLDWHQPTIRHHADAGHDTDGRSHVGYVYRCVVALATAITCGHVIGFRFYQGAGNTVGFCVLVLLIGIVVAVAGDLIGMASATP